MHTFYLFIFRILVSDVTYYPLLAVLTDAVIAINTSIQISMYVKQFDNKYYHYTSGLATATRRNSRFGAKPVGPHGGLQIG